MLTVQFLVRTSYKSPLLSSAAGCSSRFRLWGRSRLGAWDLSMPRFTARLTCLKPEYLHTLPSEAPDYLQCDPRGNSLPGAYDHI